MPQRHLRADEVDLTWRFFEQVIEGLSDICIMVANDVAVLLLPRPCAARKASREASGVVGSFLEWRLRWSLQ